MPAPLPVEIDEVVTSDGVRYRLPRPAWSLWRWAGWALLGFGLLPGGMGITFLVEMAGKFLGGPFPFILFAWLTMLFPLLFVAAGLALMFLGAWLAVGRTEIELTSRKLKSIMCVGPFRWTRWRARHQVREFTVRRLPSSGDSASPQILYTLAAECHTTKPLKLVFGYPRDWLLALAHDLAQRCPVTEATTLSVPSVLPVDVNEDPGERKTSRSWQHSRKPAVVQAGGCMFFGIFFVVGCVLLVFILSALVRGDPGKNLQGDFPLKCLWALFPLPFIAIGAGGLLYVRNNRGKAAMSPEQQKAAEFSSQKPPGGEEGSPTRSYGRENTDADISGPEYPTLPALAPAPEPGLPIRLAIRDPVGCNVLALLIGFVICSGILTPLVTYAVNGLLEAKRLVALLAPAGFFSLFLGIGWVMLVVGLVKQFLLWRLGQPVVEISAQPLYPGEKYQFFLSQPGPLVLKSLCVTLVCEEEATYTQGTDTRKETRFVYFDEVLRQDHLVIEKDMPFEIRHEFRVPPGAMHSFEAEHNKIRWMVRVEGAVSLRPTFKHEFPLVVYPPRNRKGEA
jgi:hypothetical protein